jgi:hypothetical protein
LHFIRFFAALLMASSGLSYAEVNPYADNLKRLQQIAKDAFWADLPNEEAASRVSAAYRTLYGNVDAQSIKDRPDILKMMFEASNTAAFYTDNTVYANEMQRYFDLLKSAGDIDTARGVAVHGAYVAAEEFEAAAQFAAQNPELNLTPVPAVLNQTAQGALQEWHIAPANGKLFASEFVMPRGPYLIVASSIRCHFSLDSMRALEHFPDLDNLNGRTKWLMRVERRMDFASVAQWNTEHPQFQFSIPKKYAGWTDITSWDTPTFYFFNAGKMVYKFSGWPAEGNFDKLKRGMTEAGFFNQAE